MAKSNSTPTPADAEKLEIILTKCGAYAETVQRLASLITEASSPEEFAAKDREYLAHAIDHISGLMVFLAEEGEKLLRGLPQSKPSVTSLFLGPRYREICEPEVANG